MSFQFITPYSVRVGVVGAGTMGSGIALAALQSNLVVTLYEVSPQVLANARSYLEKHLQRKGQEGNLRNLTLTERLEDLAAANIIIEAVPEELSLKQELFARLNNLCPPPAILATNTSTLPVTAIAASVQTPQRVAGMHFFNPAPVMPLVEVIRGARTDEASLQSLVTLAEKMGKTPVVVKDTPGFIVNRVARPFYGEALRLVGEGTARVADIDRLVRQGAGFRMGPFQLMDLIGIDINFAATQSMWEQSFHEPRYRPHPIQAQMIQQKALGQKTGRGFYDYSTPTPPEDPVPSRPKLPPARQDRPKILFDSGSWAPGLSELFQESGYETVDLSPLRSIASSTGSLAGAVISTGRSEGLISTLIELDRELPKNLPLFIQCVDVTLGSIAGGLENPERLVGFDGLFFCQGSAVTLVASPILNPSVRTQAENILRSLGKLPVWIQDSPALILPRILAMLANEAAFAVGEGVAEPEMIDRAMQLGTNYPYGPLSWAENTGYSRVATILNHLQAELGEDRYRVAPALHRWANWKPGQSQS